MRAGSVTETVTERCPLVSVVVVCTLPPDMLACACHSARAWSVAKHR